MGEIWNSETGQMEPVVIPEPEPFTGPMVRDIGEDGKAVEVYNPILGVYERVSRPSGHTYPRHPRDSMVTSDGKDIGEIPLSRMNRDALLLVADAEGITIAAGMTNHQIAEALRAKRESA